MLSGRPGNQDIIEMEISRRSLALIYLSEQVKWY